MTNSSPDGMHLKVATGSASYDGSLESVYLYKADGTPYPVPTKQAAQADSVAASTAALVTDFNALLAKLRLAGILT